MSVHSAVQRDLEAFPEEFSQSALAAAALALAEAIDESENSLTARAAAAKELRETMTLLRSLAPVEVVADAVDDLVKQRKKRQADATIG